MHITTMTMMKMRMVTTPLTMKRTEILVTTMEILQSMDLEAVLVTIHQEEAAGKN
jgi:hypothetical protein